MFRRRGQRLFRGMGNPNVPPMLQRANQLMAEGKYAEAAQAYANLAQGAENRFPNRAPFLFMAAGNAAVLSGDTKAGLAHMRHGLTILAAQGRFPRMRAFGQRAMDELRARNLNAEADEIASLLNANLPHGIPAAVAAPKKPILPTHCPSCGGAVRPDEIDWLDEITAECAYCGSPLRGEG
jgi:hypothetical protein